MPKYLLWSDNDPNDTFEVEADTPNDAAFAALSELGWVMGDGGEDEDEEPECEDCGVEMTEDESLDAFADFNRVICEDCAETARKHRRRLGIK